jgi:hypothetical protein
MERLWHASFDRVSRLNWSLIGDECRNQRHRIIFSLICKVDQSVGFNWENAEWKLAHYRPETYVITKLNPSLKECSLFALDKQSPAIAFAPDITGLNFGMSFLGFQNSPHLRVGRVPQITEKIK